MKQKSFSIIKQNQGGYLLPYMLFLTVILLNIFIFTITICLNESKTFNDKDKYYHVFIFEERAKQYVYEKLKDYPYQFASSEIIYYDQDFIYYSYSYDGTNQFWEVEVKIGYDTYYVTAYIYYYKNDDTIKFKNK